MVAKRRRADWPRGPFAWHTDEASYASIPFTWNLPEVHAILKELTLFPRPTFVGGSGSKYCAGTVVLDDDVDRGCIIQWICISTVAGHWMLGERVPRRVQPDPDKTTRRLEYTQLFQV